MEGMNLLPQTQVDKRCPVKKKKGNQPKSNSEPHPDWLAGDLVLVTEAAFPSPRCLKNPGSRGRKGLSHSAHCVTLSPPHSTPHGPLIWGMVLLSWSLGISAQAGRAGAQGPAFPVHRPDPARAGVSEPPGPPSGLTRGKSLPCLVQLHLSLPSPYFPSLLNGTSVSSL